MNDVMEFDCVHLRESRGTMTCNLCGLKGNEFTLFRCELHGLCSSHRMHRNIRSCAACEDRATPMVDSPPEVKPELEQAEETDREGVHDERQ